MNAIKYFSFALILLILFPSLLMAQSPTLKLYDVDGNEFWAPDNSTVFEAIPGSLFTLLLEGKGDAQFGLYLSLFKTPFPTNTTPPPLLLMPPLFPIMVGFLDPSGIYSFSAYLPAEYSSLGYDFDFYVQGFTNDTTNGVQLTNGITVTVTRPEYEARVAVARGNDLSSIVEFGEIRDDNVNDNQLPAGGGSGLENGEPIIPDPDMASGSNYAFEDGVTVPAGSPDPSMSIYLNGIFPLVPGDSGVDSRFTLYPPVGSSLYVHTRDRICRSAENKQHQYIIVPIFDENGQKTHDLNVYQFRDETKGEYGFMVFDVLNHDYYELNGTRQAKQAVPAEPSPWSPYVAISPDGRYMSAVKHVRPDADVTTWKDKLFVIKLLKDDTWSTGNHARVVTINEVGNDKFWVNAIYAESMTFAGDPEPHGLFFIANLFDTKEVRPQQEPPNDVPAALWSVKASVEKAKGKYHNFLNSTTLPKASNAQYPFSYFGAARHYTSTTDKNLTEVRMMRTDDNKTICIRGAGRWSEWDSTNSEWQLGGYAWEVLGITNIVNDSNGFSYDFVNMTQFDEAGTQNGFYLYPFGHCYGGGLAKAHIGPPTPQGLYYMAIVTKSYTASNESEDLYVLPLDASLAGSLQPVTNPNVFKGEFQSDTKTWGSGLYDPFFITPDTLVFNYGRRNGKPGSTEKWRAEGDLFLYNHALGEYRNLTQTGVESANPPTFIKEPVPPFYYFGMLKPYGLFPSRDGRYLFYFRSNWTLYGVSKKVNLLGIDIQNDFTVFDLSGDDYSHGITPDLDNEADQSAPYYWGPETQNLVLTRAGITDLLFFTAKYQTLPETDFHEVFMVNMDYPIAAIPITSFTNDNPQQPGLIDNLVVDSTGTYVAFSRSNEVKGDWTEGGWENLYVVDLSQGAYRKELTVDYAPFSRASIDGSFQFLPSTSTRTPVQLIYGMGPGGNQLQADNPKGARMWLYPIEDLANPSIPSYPLTEANQILFFGTQPMD